MAKRTPDERDALPGEPEMHRLYRDAARELPPPALDAQILAAARRAVETPSAYQRIVKRWTVPLSVAAVVMLTVGVVLRLTHERALEETATLSAPPAAPAAATEPTARAEVAPPAPASPAREKPTARVRAEAGRDVDALHDAAPPASHSAPPERLARQDDAPMGAVAQQALRATPAHADVTAVRVRGRDGAYEFEVEIKSPDTSCQQYADWWEVVSTDGKLIHRRVLAHSHADEQPFARTGGPVPIAADTVVWVRAHMNTTGYGGAAFKGSPAGGFVRAELPPSFAADVARQPPLPDGCAF